MDVTDGSSQAESKRPALGSTGIGYAVCWAVLGAAACATTFAISALPAPLPEGRSIPLPLYLVELLLAVVMLPTCAVIPIPLLVTQYRRMRTLTGTGNRWVTAWLMVGSVAVGVEALFLYRFLRFLTLLPRFVNLASPSWHAFGFAVGFLVAGVAMVVVLIGARRSLA